MKRFRGDVEGLRGVAVLAVVCYHAGFGGTGGGFVGVDVFFVISGFLITGLLWRELESSGRISFGAFYGRRLRRLLPAAAVVLVVTTVVSAWVLSPLQARDVIHDAQSAALYVANYRFAALRTDYLAGQAVSPIQHYWSLAVEEQFYLVWPLLILGAVWIAARFGAAARTTLAVTLGAVSLASFVLSVYLTHASQPWAFFSLPTRAWELGTGRGRRPGATCVHPYAEDGRRVRRLARRRRDCFRGGRGSAQRLPSPERPRSCPLQEPR